MAVVDNLDQKSPSKEEDDNLPKSTLDKNQQNALSEEDKLLEAELFQYVESIKSSDDTIRMNALNNLTKHIREATCSMTSVPKPLKLLKSKLYEMIQIYDENSIENQESKSLLAEIISVVGMTVGFKGICLTYRLKSGNNDIVRWGHEYIKHLSGEMCMAGQDTSRFDDLFSDEFYGLMNLANVVVPYFLSHNSEADAVDLLGDFENLEFLEQHCDKDNYQRVCQYLNSCANYLTSEGEDLLFLRYSFRLYFKFENYYRAMEVAIRMRCKKYIEKVFPVTKPKSLQLQLAYLLSNNGWKLLPVENDQDIDQDLKDALFNVNLSSNFLWLARELDVLEPKTTKDVYKTYLTENITRHSFGGSRDSSLNDRSRQRIADVMVNAFVNAGFCNDSVMSVDENEYLINLKEYGLFTAIATIGIIHLWDVDGGLLALDKFTYSSDDYVKGGAMFGYGLLSANVMNECDPVLAICSNHIAADQKLPVRVGSVMGLGVAYAGTGHREIMTMLMKCIETSEDVELNAMSILSIGMIGVGTCRDNHEMITSVVNWMISQKSVVQLDPLMRLAALGVALFFYKEFNKLFIKDILDLTVALTKPLADIIKILVLSMSAAGKGDMLCIQELLSMGYHLNALSKPDPEPASEPDAPPINQKDIDEYNHAPSVIATSIIAIGLISMGDEIGTDMTFRMLCQLLHIGNHGAKKAVPLAIALLAISNPKLNFMDTLVKFAHDGDQALAQNSIIALGIIGAGTNNARIGSMLRQLAVFHSKDHVSMMSIRIAQGLLHFGKGTISLNPFRSDRFILNPIAISGIMATVMTSLEPKSMMIRHPYHFLMITLAAHPRFLITIDEETKKPINLSVRVGQAVDVVGQAGNPKKITGFQTHNTPVLLNYGERAELTTGEEEYTPLSPILEGVVIVKKQTSTEIEDEDMNKSL